MMGCFSTSQTDGTEESFRMSLRSLLATKETPIPGPCIAKQIIERKFGFGTRKTLQARTNMLDTACHSLAKAKQRCLVSLPPSYYIKSEILLFPLPLPPGYKPNSTNNSKPSSTSRKLLTANSNRAGKSTASARRSAKEENTAEDSKECKSSCGDSKKTDEFTGDFSVVSSNTSCTSPDHSSVSNSTFTCSTIASHLYSCEALTPTSPTSSSSTVFSAAPSTSAYSLSQSSSFNSSSSVFSDLRGNSLSNHENEDINVNSLSFSCTSRPVSCPLKEFSPMEITRAFESFGHPHMIATGTMGPFYKLFLPEEKCSVAVTKVVTNLSRKKWRAQIQAFARLAHPNLSKVIGYSYERAKYVDVMEGISNDNMGFIVYEDIGDESLEDFLQDVEKGIDWITRLKLAIGIAEGLSFLLENMPSHVDYGYLTLSNLRVDFALNAKLFDFVLLSNNTNNLKEKRVHNVVASLGNVLLQLFDFERHPPNGEPQDSWASLHLKRSYPLNDAKVLVDLVDNCLLPKASVLQVVRVLRSIEPIEHVAQYTIKHSKSFTYKKKRSLSFG
ncbi:hypothetical protein GOP47_0022894 [Adiantum capillus-veneris]|uniref:Protein kinase domain-containing protein n=1 Tax=Adiantum capillus-veneris TaxID=13818 RepID=A0A9D4U748_ADICA|nr:hypothetical protein GOP47_0022894 [Adiantum capillus-veneris]